MIRVRTAPRRRPLPAVGLLAAPPAAPQPPGPAPEAPGVAREPSAGVESSDEPSRRANVTAGRLARSAEARTIPFAATEAVR